MKTEARGQEKRARGRPKMFDRSAALQQAMKLFWERGYTGASFDDLIEAMGISPSSFYNTFGSKERLFQEAAAAYVEQTRQWFAAELEAAVDTRTAFRRMLKAAVREATRDDLPAGCMVSLACTQVPPALESVRQMMAGYRCGAEAAMAGRIQRGIEEGDVPEGTDVQALAAYYSALLRGMAVLARDGANRDRLIDIVETGMRAWPLASPEPPQSAVKDATVRPARRRARLGQTG